MVLTRRLHKLRSFLFLCLLVFQLQRGRCKGLVFHLKSAHTHIGYVSFRVWFRVSVVMGKVPTAGFSQEGHTNTLEWICGLGIECFGQSGVWPDESFWSKYNV